jgi:hypothetical protein
MIIVGLRADQLRADQLRADQLRADQLRADQLRADQGSTRSKKQAAGSETRGQTGLAANFRQTAPEIHASLVCPRGGADE